MRIKLIRTVFTPYYTMGELIIDKDFICYTVEDTVRDHNQDGDLLDEGEGKVYGETAIPYGTYEVDLTMSPKFKRLLPILMDVPHFEGIRIHRGNTAKDSQGCILPGYISDEPVEGTVVKSADAEMRIIELIYKAKLRGEKITIDVVKK